ncbi:hypothetical protein DICVIV_00846 [Dictyocaulus viviparus]|uniref:Uncharacterized protein n=1 Tax=Dictyocaulus viviparus TaxID=29172 RepID=A0A0D8Y9U8_DICVI|nr:hypothetical protein DICVIV_00846 [Dictyocaulus viviparus]
MSRVLNGFPSSVGPLLEALRPLKTSILSQSLAKLYRIVEDHDFTNQDSMLVDLLVPTIEEEVRRLEWDVELREGTQKNVNKCLNMLAKRLESEIKLDAENLLIGDRLRSDQLKHYKLLEIANSLVHKWPAQSLPLLSFERECVSTIMDSIRANIFAIVGSMHRDMIGNKEISPYMQLDQYVEWCSDHSDKEIVSFLSGLMSSYTKSVVNQHETEFVPHYPIIMQLIKKAT